jgi:hypothetical protein
MIDVVPAAADACGFGCFGGLDLAFDFDVVAVDNSRFPTSERDVFGPRSSSRFLRSDGDCFCMPGMVRLLLEKEASHG